MNDAQARSYIQGEKPFDEVQHRIDHVNMLVRSVHKHISDYGMKNQANMIRTVSRYIENNSHAANVEKLRELLEEIENGQVF